MFNVRLGRLSRKFYERADEKLKARLKELFLFLAQNPFPASQYDLKKIGGEESSYRIRLSSYRVLYTVSRDEKVIRVTKIEKKDDHTYD